MQRRSWLCQSITGAAIPACSITVYTAGTTTKATIYGDQAGSSALGNPITAGSDGTYTYYAANGRYTEVLSASGFTFGAAQTQDFILNDPVTAPQATTTSVNFLRIINVLDFGAKGDGVTDGTTAIQAAYTAVPSTGGTVYFPAGTYIITGTILPKAETLTLGAGKNATTIRLTSTTSGLQAFLVTLKNRVSFEKLRIEINGNNQIGLEYAGSQENQIRDVIFYSLVLGNGTGVLVHSSGTPGSFTHTYDSDQWENLAIGIQFGVNGEATGANNHTVIDGKATSNGTGYLFTNATNVTLIGSRAENNTSIGIDGAPNAGDLANNITVVGHYFELNTTRHYRVSTRCADWLFANTTIVGGTYQDNGTNTKFIGNALGTPTGFNIYTNGLLSASIDQNGVVTSKTLTGTPNSIVNITGNNLALFGSGTNNAIGYKNSGDLRFQTIADGQFGSNVDVIRFANTGGIQLFSGGAAPTGGDKGAGTINIATGGGYYINGVQIATMTLTNASGTIANAAHMVQDTVTLTGGTAGVALAGAAAFANSTSYTCVCDNDSAVLACRVVQNGGTGFTVSSGAGTDVVRFICVGS